MSGLTEHVACPASPNPDRDWSATMAVDNETSLPELHKDLAKARIWDRCIPEPNSGCWLWMLEIRDDGYGSLRFKTQRWLAHRLSWCAHRSSVPAGVFVCHKCDVPACVNPDHLFLGTHQENMDDMIRKDRGAAGERHGATKLTADQVAAILLDERLLGEIAAEYGVTQTAIYNIKRGARWRRQHQASPLPVFRRLRKKLTPEGVRRIRSGSESLSVLARDLNVSTATVWLCRKGATHKRIAA